MQDALTVMQFLIKGGSLKEIVLMLTEILLEIILFKI